MTNKRSATIGRTKGTSAEHSRRLAEHIKERDAEPIEVWTAFGLWQSGKNGTSQTDHGKVRIPWDTTKPGSIEPYDGLPPINVASKQKYRGG